jgi:hypothetical protein
VLFPPMIVNRKKELTKDNTVAKIGRSKAAPLHVE